ncbi:hypothetical protein [Thalassotalea piscium]|uniref:CRISPR/Cas system CSM-associated protein Csm5 (Group 7 of RAMP superfamily) n=1 Tax=Thalassotalea piscium TaxID=1230533 RepID=A0A7X0TTA6_9GAMM|nr:hypothetical protein [Thalassotalea piscium]MBB6543047.1 CRISPR/Cas system CSM-associated protein Csm5 (group 7 of RAMP superfamily) [Thalassotalea piscium]
MFILDAWKLYNLRKIEMQIQKQLQKKEAITSYLKSIDMLPSKYESDEQPLSYSVSYSFSFNENGKDKDIIEINFEDLSTQEDGVANINKENILIASNTHTDVVNDDSKEMNTCLATFKVRIVSIDLEREIVYVQKWTDANTQISESNLIDIFVEEPLLKKLPIGEHAELSVLSNNNVIFAFDNGEKIAC